MTITGSSAAEALRVTIHGPQGRVDLAVPSVTTVGALIVAVAGRLLPVDAHEGSWVLQRLDEAPFDPDGTPETLDWRDGERFHLRPASDPLPELDFDDIADGMATAVRRRPDRWNRTVNRLTFLGLAAVAFGTTAVVLGRATTPSWRAVGALVLTGGMMATAALVGYRRGDRALAAVLGLAGCGYAGLFGLFTAHRSGPILLGAGPDVLMAGAAGVLLAAVTLLALQRLVAPRLPIEPLGIAGGIGLGVVVAMGLYLGTGMTAAQDAGVVGIACLNLLIAAPLVATRAARLRGPQLPRTAEDLQIDVEPYHAEEVVTRVDIAEAYLTVLAGVAAVLVAGACWYLLRTPNWMTCVFAALLASSLLLRAREFRSIPQRLFLVAGGVVGGEMVIDSVTGPLSSLWRVLTLTGLIFAGYLLVLAALRPETRRLLPIWGYLANVLETLGTLALMPLMMYLLGVFAWARGLAG
ncbi:MAG TPA: type VII secretion integral membrane protein EccD [Rugosimonospora sp.]|nr:type VII secretion integral membrane protein EccD [Rugosimonospora sp.]